jgi:hypothetical protein
MLCISLSHRFIFPHSLAAVKKKYEKKSILKQRRKNYEEFILKPKLEATKKRHEGGEGAQRPKRSDDGRADAPREKKKQKTSH